MDIAERLRAAAADLLDEDLAALLVEAAVHIEGEDGRRENAIWEVEMGDDM